MTIGELKAALAEILNEEEAQAIDWDRVQDLSITLLGRIRNTDEFEYPTEIVIPYLTDFGLRRADDRQAQMQQARLIGYLRGH